MCREMERISIPRLDQRALKCDGCAIARISVFDPSDMLLMDFRLKSVMWMMLKMNVHGVFDWHCLVPGICLAKLTVPTRNVSGTRYELMTPEIGDHSWTTSGRDYYYGRQAMT